jgi:hypothetical protein
MPYTPGAVLGPNSKTTRSKPGLCAIRIAVSCACVFAEPPVRSGQAVAGVLPGLAAPVGLGPPVAVGTGVSGTGVTVRVAVGAVVVPVVGATVAVALTLGLCRGRTTRSGPQAPTTTTARAIRSAPYRRRRPFNVLIVTYPRCSVEFTYKLAIPFVRRAYETGVNSGSALKSL